MVPVNLSNRTLSPGGKNLSLKSDDRVEDFSGQIANARSVTLEFSKFSDGRAFTQARRLRGQMGFTGEIRAIGHILPDQAAFLQRCGFDRAEFSNENQAREAKHSLKKFSVRYQPATGVGETAAIKRRAIDLEKRYRKTPAKFLLKKMIEEEFPEGISLVSSFGAESAVLLHMVSEIKPELDIVFVDTGKLFGETRRYRDRLISHLGLKNVRTVAPAAPDLNANDPKGNLWIANANLCCYTRRVLPLQQALSGVTAWISGRKGYQGAERSTIKKIETADGRIKINPLADWSKEDVDNYFLEYDLPRHPLEADGYLSIGCMPCTSRVAPGEDIRAGRWRGQEKTECGIHLPEDTIRQAARIA